MRAPRVYMTISVVPSSPNQIISHPAISSSIRKTRTKGGYGAVRHELRSARDDRGGRQPKLAALHHDATPVDVHGHRTQRGRRKCASGCTTWRGRRSGSSQGTSATKHTGSLHGRRGIRTESR